MELKLFKNMKFSEAGNDGNEGFSSIASGLSKKNSNVRVISMKGYPAGHVNLYEIKKRILDYWETNHGSITREELKDLVEQELPCIIQRFKGFWEMKLTVDELYFKFRAKTDLGGFMYEIYVYLEEPCYECGEKYNKDVCWRNLCEHCGERKCEHVEHLHEKCYYLNYFYGYFDYIRESPKYKKMSYDNFKLLGSNLYNAIQEERFEDAEKYKNEFTSMIEEGKKIYDDKQK